MGFKDNGQRDRRHVSAGKRADVVAKVRALEQQRDQGVTSPGGKAPSVEEWLNHWVDTIAPTRIRPVTLARYRGLLKNQIIPKLGHHRLDRLRPEHIERAWAELLATGLAPSSVLQAHRVLSRSLKVATQRGRIVRNPATLVDAPSVPPNEVTPISNEDARKLLTLARSQRNGARWAVALALGLRQGEALGLPWDAIDLDRGTLRVRQALQRQRGRGLVFVEPKSMAGRRTIVLPVQLLELLRDQRRQQVHERIAAQDLWQEHGLVFAQPNGKPIDPRRDHLDWHRLLRQAGVPRARLHNARHTAATVMLQMGVPPRVAMGVLGHSQISLTLGTYCHVIPELANDAAERIGQGFWGGDDVERPSPPDPPRPPTAPPPSAPPSPTPPTGWQVLPQRRPPSPATGHEPPPPRPPTPPAPGLRR